MLCYMLYIYIYICMYVCMYVCKNDPIDQLLSPSSNRGGFERNEDSEGGECRALSAIVTVARPSWRVIQCGWRYYNLLTPTNDIDRSTNECAQAHSESMSPLMALRHMAFIFC
jgi:hypothetical protein